MTPEQIADNVKRLREIYTGNRANFLEIKTINALVELVGETHKALDCAISATHECLADSEHQKK